MGKRQYKKVRLNRIDNNKEEISELSEDNSKLKPYMATQNLYGESLLFFNTQKLHDKKYRQFYGIGKVFRVVKGEKQDLIYVRFSVLPTAKIRLVVAYDNHARRQVLTLKRGQVCQIYGVSREFTTDFISPETQEKKKVVRLGLYASGILGWYVPTMIDIKRMPINEDLVAPSEKEEEMQDKFEEVLNEFLNDKGDK